jgi:translation initiation factor IF-3
MFKGRELAYTDKGEELLNKFIERVEEVSKVETPVRMEGKAMSMILVPSKTKSKKIN